MPKVVFPDPDSPTIPNVCPSKTFMFTLFTFYSFIIIKNALILGGLALLLFNVIQGSVDSS